MSSETGKFVRELIRRQIHPVLKGQGFRRRGQNWNRRGVDLTQAVNVQSSWFEQFGDLTINLGVHVDGLLPTPNLPASFIFVAGPYCHLRLRIGNLMPTGRDRWWTFDTSSSDLDEIGRQAAGAILQYGLPFLNRSRSARELDELLDEDELNPFFHADLKARLGNRRGAEKLLAQEFNEGDARQSAALRHAKQLGIDLQQLVHTPSESTQSPPGSAI